MATLYNCHHDGDQYRITKFNELGEPESSYLCTETECECPAGVRPTCRHRQMLPKFLAREAVDSYWFYDFDRGGWVTNEPATPRATALDDLGYIDERVAPEGLTVEPRLEAALNHFLGPHSPTVTTADFDSADGGSIPPVAASDADDYGEDPIGLESLPPKRPAWRRI